jgi:hypothetical protein
MMVGMTPELTAAMNALRAWSAPGVRAQLIANAWNAGEHRISALADAAGLTRPTVYDALESCGIDPKTDRQEPPTMQSITLDGWTGHETDEEADKRHQAAYATFADLPRDERVTAFGNAMDAEYYKHKISRWHNQLLPYAERVLAAQEDAQRALRVVETRWAALRTARSWHAAHHTYVEALHAARAALAQWSTAVDDHDTKKRQVTGGFVSQADYDRHIPAEHRLPVIDSAAPKVAKTELEETYRQRRAIVRETLSLQAEETTGTEPGEED